MERIGTNTYNLMGLDKMYTTAYHPQSDGLVERFNRTLTDMLAKTVERIGTNAYHTYSHNGHWLKKK